MPRPSEDQTNLKHARVASERSTCIRRSVGCALVDENDHLLSTGRNGVPKGQPHCNEGFPCEGANAPSGTNLTQCKAIHAEINAIAHCTDPSKVHTIYVTDAPCKFCCDALMALPNAKRIVAAAPYAGAATSQERWEAMGRTWEIQPIIMTHWFGWDVAREESLKPHKGRIEKWRKLKYDFGGLGYRIHGTLLDHPSLSGRNATTSLVIKHDQKTGEIETENTRYTLVGESYGAE